MEQLNGKITVLPDPLRARITDIWKTGTPDVPQDAPWRVRTAAPLYGSLVGHTVDEILSREADPTDWLVPGMIAFGAVTSLAGYVGAGKTPLAVRLARAVREGTLFLGQPTHALPGEVRVAYLTEETTYTFDRALRDAGVGPDKDFAVFYFDENASVGYKQAIADAAAWTEGGFLVVDTAFFWSRISELGAENDPGRMNEVYRPLVAAAARGCAVWAHAHTVKIFDALPDEDASIAHVRGSGAVVANSSLVLLYKKLAGDPTSSTRFLRVGRTRLDLGDVPMDRYVGLADGQLVVRAGISVEMERTDHLVDRLARVIEALGGEVSGPDLRKRWGKDWHDLQEAIKLGVQVGRLKQSGAGKKGSPYVYSLLEPSEDTPETIADGATTNPDSLLGPMFPTGNSFLQERNASDSLSSITNNESAPTPSHAEAEAEVIERARADGRLVDHETAVKKQKKRLKRQVVTTDEVIGKALNEVVGNGQAITLKQGDDGAFGMEEQP